MNRQEFELLRTLPGKVIAANIEWTSPRDAKPNLIFELVPVQNSLEWDVVVNGTYKPDVPSVSYNFVLRGVGPICRLDINGTVHHPAGRNHKHDLRRDTDPRNNLPSAFERNDLAGKSAREIWVELCRLANITHTGTFKDPEAPCP